MIVLQVDSISNQKIFQQRSLNFLGIELQSLTLANGLQGHTIDGHTIAPFSGCINNLKANSMNLPLQVAQNSSGNIFVISSMSNGIGQGCRGSPVCQSSPCPKNTTYCLDTWESYSCIDLGACRSNPCQNNATCVPSTSSNANYTCQCATNYTGKMCETAIVCLSSPCSQGTTCQGRSGGGFICVQPQGGGLGGIIILVIVLAISSAIIIGVLIFIVIRKERRNRDRKTKKETPSLTANVEASPLNQANGDHLKDTNSTGGISNKAFIDTEKLQANDHSRTDIADILEDSCSDPVKDSENGNFTESENERLNKSNSSHSLQHGMLNRSRGGRKSKPSSVKSLPVESTSNRHHNGDNTDMNPQHQQHRSHYPTFPHRQNNVEIEMTTRNPPSVNNQPHHNPDRHLTSRMDNNNNMRQQPPVTHNNQQLPHHHHHHHHNQPLKLTEPLEHYDLDLTSIDGDGLYESELEGSIHNGPTPYKAYRHGYPSSLLHQQINRLSTMPESDGSIVGELEAVSSTSDEGPVDDLLDDILEPPSSTDSDGERSDRHEKNFHHRKISSPPLESNTYTTTTPRGKSVPSRYKAEKKLPPATSHNKGINDNKLNARRKFKYNPQPSPLAKNPPSSTDVSGYRTIKRNIANNNQEPILTPPAEYV